MQPQTDELEVTVYVRHKATGKVDRMDFSAQSECRVWGAEDSRLVTSVRFNDCTVIRLVDAIPGWDVLERQAAQEKYDLRMEAVLLDEARRRLDLPRGQCA